MNVILYDQTTSLGHHTTYFNRILSILIEKGYRVYILFENPDAVEKKEHPQVVVLEPGDYRGLVYKLMLKAGRIILSKAALSLAHILTVRQVIRHHNLSNVVAFFPYMDSVLPSVNYKPGRLFVNFRFSGIYMLPLVNSGNYFNRNAVDRLRREEYLKMASSCLLLNDAYTQYFDASVKQTSFFTLPELLELNQTGSWALAIKKAADGRTIIGIIGSLVRKKNFLRFLETAIQLKSDYYFLIVGKWPKDTYSESELARMQSYLDELKACSWQETDTYIPTEENYNEWISACDIVWLHHPKHPFSSNSLIKAMAMKKPVLVAPGYIMEEVVKSYKWSTVVEDNVGSIVRAIQHINKNFKVPVEEHQRLLKDHAPEKFKEQILKAIAACE